MTAGEIRSRGIEFDFSGQLTNKIRLLANYAYIDAKIIKDINVALQNVRLTNIPKHGGSLLAMYEDGFNGSRYGVGAGVNYVGKRADRAEYDRRFAKRGNRHDHGSRRTLSPPARFYQPHAARAQRHPQRL